jgi:23S rRNA (guanosine2251-2'-O)-methyltransferase
LEQFIFGIRPVIEAIESEQRPEKVLIQLDLKGDMIRTLFQLVRKKQIPYQMVPGERLNRLSSGNHQGVIAYVPLITYKALDAVVSQVVEEGETPLIVLLDGVTDVRNMGAIARTAACAGAHALVIPEKGGAPVNADAIKASAGALSVIPVCRERTLVESVSFLKECGLHVLVCDDKGKESLYKANLNQPLAVVMGAEDKGVSHAIRKLADQVINIPMKGRISSLNVSVATGIVLFEAGRQRDGNGKHSKP